MTNVPHKGDDDIPEPDHEENFYQYVMAGQNTETVILPKLRTLIDDFEAIELPTLKPEHKIQGRGKRTQTVHSLPVIDSFFKIQVLEMESQFASPLKRYPNSESQKLFGVLEILSRKNGLNQETVDNSIWLKKYKNSLFQIIRTKTYLCSIMEIDEEEDFETEIQLDEE